MTMHGVKIPLGMDDPFVIATSASACPAKTMSDIWLTVRELFDGDEKSSLMLFVCEPVISSARSLYSPTGQL